MVKHLELHEEFQLTGMSSETGNVARAGFDNSNVFQRMWVGAERSVFDVSPFLSLRKDDLTGSSSGDNKFNHDYLSNAWYQLQLILNARQRPLGPQGDRLGLFVWFFERCGLNHGFHARGA